MSATQCDKIVRYLAQEGSYLTSYKALVILGIYRLASRIHDLERRGYTFYRVWDENVNVDGEKVRFLRYYLKSMPAEKEAENGTDAC